MSISNKESPQIVGSYSDGDRGEALDICGDDISDPSNPKEVGTVANLNGAHDIYVAEGKHELMVLKWIP